MKNQTSQQVLGRKTYFSPKCTKTKITALARSIDLKGGWTCFIEQIVKIKGLGKKSGSITSAYRTVCFYLIYHRTYQQLLNCFLGLAWWHTSGLGPFEHFLHILELWPIKKIRPICVILTF